MLVSFLCNDERGHFTERVDSVRIEDLIALTCQKPRPPTMRVLDRVLKVGRASFPRGDRTPWVGNVYWDGIQMRLGDARRLVSHLVNNGWSVDEWAHSGPFAIFGAAPKKPKLPRARAVRK